MENSASPFENIITKIKPGVAYAPLPEEVNQYEMPEMRERI